MADLRKSILSSVLSALLLALILSLWNDFIYKGERLSGYWRAEFETTESTYSKYIGLKTRYDFVINQEGDRLVGSGEKVSENSVNGIIEYEPAKRTHLELTGAVTYKVFSDNSVDIQYKEDGRLRPSSTILSMTVQSGDMMTGRYISTIAGSRGTAKFTRVKGQQRVR